MNEKKKITKKQKTIQTKFDRFDSQYQISNINIKYQISNTFMFIFISY